MTHRSNVNYAVLEDRAKFIRTETVRLTRIAGAGHYSSTFSCAEILAAQEEEMKKLSVLREKLATERNAVIEEMRKMEVRLKLSLVKPTPA